MVRDGLFPPPVRIGKAVYWSQAALERWLVESFSHQESWTPRAGSRRKTLRHWALRRWSKQMWSSSSCERGTAVACARCRKRPVRIFRLQYRSPEWTAAKQREPTVAGMSAGDCSRPQAGMERRRVRRRPDLL